VFVVGALAKGVPITAIYRRVLPFIAIDIVRLLVVTAFPVLALVLVRALN
jgi:TRAP-type C4-dicarboxylate transport system permease large subunit